MCTCIYVCVEIHLENYKKKKKKKIVNFNFIHKSISYQVRLGRKLFS